MNRTHRLRRAAMGALALLFGIAIAACGDDDVAAPRAPLPLSPDVGLAVARAAEAIWKSIDNYDPKSFAALSVEPKDKSFRPLEVKEVESFVTELHQKYGARNHQIVPGSPPTVASESVTVYVVIGDREDALSLTFQRISGAWKLSSISNADPLAVGPNAK